MGILKLASESQCLCTFGLGPLIIKGSLLNIKLNKQVVVTQSDVIMNQNIIPAPLCTSQANPAVAAATAAAFGTPTPSSCLPIVTIIGEPTVLVSKIPIVTTQSQMQCVYGGKISVLLNTQYTVF